MHVISFLNQKGGSGKTTMATNVARALHLGWETRDADGNLVDFAAGLETSLVDSDPQGSARDWAAAGESAGVLTLGIDRARSLATDVRRLPADVVVIDGAPQAAELAASAIIASDLVLIPVQPSPYDVWAAEGLVQLVQQRQAIADGKPRAAFVLSRAIEGTVLAGDVREALEGYGLPVLGTAIHQRQAYPRLAARGLAVVDVRSEREAAAEVRALAREIRRLLDV